MALIAGKQLQSPLSVTGSLFGTSSYALTASFALNGGGTTVNTSSLVTTSSFNAFTSSVVTTSSFNVFTSSVVTTSSFNNYTSSVVNTSSFNNFTSSVVSTSSFNNYTSSVVTTSSFNNYTSSIITTGSSGITQTISGSLIINQNLTVLGSSSISYITSSQLNIGTNLITVNTTTPAVRFGGLAVYDSGSTGTGRTGSILWDSQENIWIYTNPSGASYDGAMFLAGPRSATMGSEVGINSGYAAVGNGSHHMTSSAIYSSGSLIRLENDTQITGSLTVVGNQTISGSIYLRSGSVVDSIGADIIIKAGVGNNAGVALYNNNSTQYLVVDDTGSYANKLTVADRLTVQGLTTTQNQIVSGSITLVGGSKITNEYDYPSIDIQAGIGGYVELLSNNQSSSVIITNQDVTINTSGGSWIFGENGTTSYPANVIAASFTGSLFGTASYATTASFALNAGDGGISQGKVLAIVTGYSNLF